MVLGGKKTNFIKDGKQQMKKRILGVLLMLCMALALVPSTVFAGTNPTTAAELKEAITNAGAGDTITLGGSFTATEDLTIGKNLTLDLNGQTLTLGDKRAYVENTANLTVRDTGTGGTITGNEVIIFHEGSGTVDVQGGTLRTSFGGGYAIYNYSTGTISISGGTVENTVGGVAIYNVSTGKITISGSAKVTSAASSSYNGTIYLSRVPSPAAIVLDVTGGTVSNTAASGEKYAVYFGPAYVTSANVGNYYSKTGGILGNMRPAPLTPEATPSAAFAATGHDSGTLSGLTAGGSYKYSTDGGSAWTNFTGATTDIASGITTANGIQVVKKGDGTTTADSAAQTIAVTQATAPTGIGKTDTSATVIFGTITGVDSTMEYKYETTGAWNPITGTTVGQLGGGNFYVRVKAAGAVLASASTKVVIEYLKATPTAADFTYSLTAVDYDGAFKPVSVTAAAGKDFGTITVKYNGDSMAPLNPGTYAVTVDTAGSRTYIAVTNLSLGNFTVNKIAFPGTTAVPASVAEAGQAGATVVLPALPSGARYGTPLASGAIAITGMSINGKTLTYTASASTAGQTGVVTIPVTGATTYNDYNVVVTVTSGNNSGGADSPPASGSANPQTGDITMLGLWAGILLISTAGLAACAVLVRKKQRKN